MKKEDLIPNKWYKVPKYNWYYKFIKIQTNSIYFKERIISSQYEGEGYGAHNPEFWDGAELADMKEVRKYLPINHPDLLFKNIEIW